MDAKSWGRIEEIFHEALKYPLPERQAYVIAACAEEKQLLEEVESLILSHELPGEFLEQAQLSAGLNLYAANDSQSRAGEVIGPYTLDSRIGRGGMGDVYLARDQRLGRRVALKLLPTSFGDDSDWIARFRQEARAASSMTHQNIAHIYEVGEFDGRQYIAMEHIEGITLRERIRRGRLGLDEAVEIAMQVVRGLAAAHAVGVLHRDVKPENIMIRPDDFVKVLDFGISKIVAETRLANREDFGKDLNETDPGTILGTARYMSPEQIRREAVDERTDIWSLGVTLYEMLAGRPPFEGSTSSEISAAILSREPGPISLDCGDDEGFRLREIVSKALQKEVEKRYASAQAVVDDLKLLKLASQQKDLLASRQDVGGDSGAARSGEALPNTSKLSSLINGNLWRRQSGRRKVLVIVVAIVLMIAMGFSVRYFMKRESDFHPDPNQLVYVFDFEYEDAPNPGKRFFFRSPDGYWVERESGGHENVFKEIGPASTDETKGLLIRNIKTTLELVIPEKEGKSRKLFFRIPPVQRWRHLGDVVYPTDSQKPSSGASP